MEGLVGEEKEEFEVLLSWRTEEMMCSQEQV